jgi:hypothetical protein
MTIGHDFGQDIRFSTTEKTVTLRSVVLNANPDDPEHRLSGLSCFATATGQKALCFFEDGTISEVCIRSLQPACENYLVTSHIVTLDGLCEVEPVNQPLLPQGLEVLKLVEDLRQLCLDRQDLLFKPQDEKTSNGLWRTHRDHYDELEFSGAKPNQFFGNCFTLSAWVYYAMGDSRRGNKLMRTSNLFVKDRLKTEHWFVKLPNGENLDPSWPKFDNLPNVSLEEVYVTGKRSDKGLPYFKQHTGT